MLTNSYNFPHANLQGYLKIWRHLVNIGYSLTKINSNVKICSFMYESVEEELIEIWKFHEKFNHNRENREF